MITPNERRRRRAAFKSILIPHPRMNDAKRRILNLMDDSRAIIHTNQERLEKAGKNRRVLLDHLFILPVIGPTAATKSKSISAVIDDIFADPDLDEEEIPVQVATLRTSTKSPRFLQSQILEAYGDPAAATLLRSRDYSEAAVNLNIRDLAREKKPSSLSSTKATT